MLSRLLAFPLRMPRFTLIIVLASLVVSGTLIGHLELRSSLKELLPEDYPSVIELNRLVDRMGGAGMLVVVAEGPDPSANRKFMDDLARELSDLPPGTIRHIAYRAQEIRQFYEDHFLYYLNVADLNTLEERIRQRINYEKIKRTPFFLDLDVPPVEVSLDDMVQREREGFRSPVNTVDDYFGGEWGRMLVMLIRPYGSNVSVESARTLMATVKEVTARLDPSSYAAPVTVGFCGNVTSTIEEYETLKRDILSTTLLCISLIAFAITLYFLRLRAVFVLAVTLFVGIVWAFGLTSWIIGYLNAQTAFLGSIIVGTGINYGIILLGRYWEERRREESRKGAMRMAMERTILPTFLAAATTAVAFAVLGLADIRGLSQFGFIGATGVMSCWMATYTVLPLMTLYSKKKGQDERRQNPPNRRSPIFSTLSHVVQRWPRGVIMLSMVALGLSLWATIRFLPEAIEYDFTKLRNRESVESGTEALERRVAKLFKDSMTPAVVLLEDPREGPELCEAVQQQNERLPLDERRVGSCHVAQDLLPDHQEEKIVVLNRLQSLLDEHIVTQLKGEARDRIERVRKSMIGRPLTIDDLPDALAQPFTDVEGGRGMIAFINPRPGMLLSDGRNLLRYAETIREIRLPSGAIRRPAGEMLIFSDLVGIIKREAPLLTIASFLGVVVFVWWAVRSRKLAAVIIGSLLWGVALMIGICFSLGIRLNFFNFIILPLTFGIGVDYAINIALRIRQEGEEGIGAALRHTGGAVFLCSLTTIIGYFVLTWATNQALATFGLAAVIGEISCLIAALVILPAWMVIESRGRKRKVNT
ncbi:MAG: MMPL family transporter [Deltaproteobacteria bacterium]|nr:MMPL family transporter [Deltaproteobacteria bacterium]